MHLMHKDVKTLNAPRAFASLMHPAHYAAMNLRTYRKAKRLTQEQLAELVGVDQATIQRAEKMHSSAKLETYVKCAEALGVTLSDLFSDERSAEEALLVIAFRSSDASRRKVLTELAREAGSQASAPVQ